MKAHLGFTNVLKTFNKISNYFEFWSSFTYSFGMEDIRSYIDFQED